MKTKKIQQLEIAREVFDRLTREAQERVREMEESLAHVQKTRTDTADRPLNPYKLALEISRWENQVEAAKIVARKLAAL